EAVVTDWVAQWGTDLELFRSDRSARNYSSYRPTRLEARSGCTPLEAIHFLKQFWLAAEPGSSPFGLLDRHLLRRALELGFSGTSGSAAQGQPWEEAVDEVLEYFTDSGLARDELRGFILRQTDSSDIQLLALAPVAGDPNDSDHHLRVISRASLLLR